MVLDLHSLVMASQYVDIESLCCIPENNAMLYINYISVLKITKRNFLLHRGIWQCLEAFSIVTTGRTLLASSQRCCRTSYNMQDSPPKKTDLAPKITSAKVEKSQCTHSRNQVCWWINEQMPWQGLYWGSNWLSKHGCELAGDLRLGG